MNEAGSNFADETVEMASESGANPNAELRKRRSTRIVQAVPLVITGVDALGRPFVERTSSLILNCHGCRYQSKHYVLKNMSVTLEIPYSETAQPPRSVRGRVAWIQRPRTVRQLFQVALELEVSGNVWGIAFPPEDWFAIPEGVSAPPVVDGAVPATLPPTAPSVEPEAPPSVSEAEFPPANASDNLRVFPSPANASEASLQLARQVAGLVADARQQIQAAAQEAASHAVSAERHLSFEEQWEQKFAAGRAEIANETSRALEKLHKERDKQSREAHAAAAEALRTELPRWLAPQLEQLTRNLTETLSREALVQRENTKQLEAATHVLRAACQQAEETAAQLKARAEHAEAQIAARADSVTRSLEEIAKQQEETARATEAQWGQRRNEMRRESESLVEQINTRIRSTFDEIANQASEEFERRIQQMLEPHVTHAEETIHRLAGNRSLVDAALTLQQERIRVSADEAFAESLVRFRENLGSVEQMLRESSQSITAQCLAELEGRVGDLKHEVLEELLKSAGWYEKKAQTQMQSHSEKAVEHTANQLEEKAREISSAFATELDQSGRNFLGHTQTQLEDAVHDSFERARALFAEAADTTTAAFIDEIQLTAREELGGYHEELKRSTAQERSELAEQVSSEQATFLKRFEESLGGVLEAGVAEAQKTVSQGFAPLRQQWKTMTDAQQQEMNRVYDRIGEQAAEQHKTRLESASNQWLLATVSSLDHQSREVISGIAATTEEKLRAACAQVFEGMGDSLRQRLSEIAKNLTPTEPPSPNAKGASQGS
jgi:F0F1-type ATP synthase membrane subunit b/b'